MTHGLYSPWNFPGQTTEVDSLSLLQRIFPTQELKPGLPHCRWILYQLSHKGSLLIFKAASYRTYGRVSYKDIYIIALKIWVIVKKGAVNPTHNITLKNIFSMQVICPRNSKTNLSFFLSTAILQFPSYPGPPGGSKHNTFYCISRKTHI